MTSANPRSLCLHDRLYLHYLDRELATSVGFQPSEKGVLEATNCLLLASPAPLYCGLSPAWESSFHLGSIPRFLAKLQLAGHLQLLSSHHTTNEFLGARIEAYKHDAARYPMYFSDDLADVSLLTPNVLNSGSTTNALRNGLKQWSVVLPELTQNRSDKAIVAKLQEAVLDTFKHRQEAVTLALFRDRLGNLNSNHLAVGVLGREISKQFTQHYRRTQNGEIPTGVRGLESYDNLSEAFPLYDLPILNAIMRSLGAHALLSASKFESFLAKRGQETHVLLADRIRVFLGGICSQAGLGIPCNPSPSNRETIRQLSVRLLSHHEWSRTVKSSIDDMLMGCIFVLNSAIDRGEKEHTEFAKGKIAMEQEIKSPQITRVLLAVAANVEHEAVLESAEEAGLRNFQQRFVGDHTYFILGQLGGCELHLVKCTAGSGGVLGALPTLLDAVRDVPPYSIVMPGIAFGLRKKTQRIGDILLSKQIMAYDLKRITEDVSGKISITPRGDRVSVPPRIFDRFWSGTRDWNLAKVHEGLILSGDTLVDSPTFKGELLSIEPEAIGGEMESAGVYVAAAKAKIDWIIVKAICDWGENKDKKHQRPAAKNAADLVFHVIRKGGLQQ